VFASKPAYAVEKSSLIFSIPISRIAGSKRKETSLVRAEKIRRTGNVQETNPAMKAIAR
jgi:hypothetical protein